MILRDLWKLVEALSAVYRVSLCTCVCFQCIQFWVSHYRRSGMKSRKLDMKISSQNRWQQTHTQLYSTCLWEHNNKGCLCVFRVIISCWRSCLKRRVSWEELSSRRQRTARRPSHIRVWSSANRSERRVQDFSHASAVSMCYDPWDGQSRGIGEKHTFADTQHN